MSDKPVAWGIIGAGAIAKAFIHGVGESANAEVVAVASRSLDKAEAFAKEHGVGTAHGSYEAILADDAVEAVYIATPHPMHPQWAIRAAEAGKHVLCEKPMAINHAGAMAMFAAAREAATFMMEAFMYRCHPQTAELVKLLRDGAIGQVRMVRATFGFGGGDSINPESRLFAPELGGGGMLDVGCYAVSMSRLIAGAVDGKPFANPEKVSGEGQLGETGVDEWAAGTLKFGNGIVAQVATAVRAGLENTVHIVGSGGSIHLPNPWAASRDQAPDSRIILRRGKETKQITPTSERSSFGYEVEAASAAIRAGRQQPESPAMTWDDTLGNLATLDRWRSAVGLTYPMEEPTHEPTLTIAERPPRRRDEAPMTYGQVAGLDKPVSRFIMGCDNQRTFAHAAVMFDDWFERGGNAFDTSWVYGGGLQERLLGQWVKARGVRDQVVVTVKGAHTPRCTPELLVRDFHTSLDRLQFDHADLYIMHRDNLDVPVGEFVETLNGLIDQGLIRGAIGGSNWSLQRFQAFNEYAQKHGKQGMSVLNNNLSLARMVKPVWGGCVHVSDTDSRKWLEQTQTANFSWSSQARGYFLPGEQRMKLGADNFSCWDSQDNRARRERAEELAAKLGVSPINIAAAYVLNQPFPSFALIGPRVIEETITSMPALNIELTREQIDWLWGGDA
jgi:predicted dehydrogenase/aryl-alcohol dehydrogenase-like predicted oxidoreductase